MSVLRFDLGTLSAPRMTPQGYMLVDGYASRVGVQEYRRSDGTIRRELRLPTEVGDAKSLAGFEGAPVTNDHPPEHLTPENTRGTAAGAVLGVGKFDGKLVAVKFAVHDKALMDDMRRGKKQLSVGYAVDLDETPGEHPEFGRYDAVQRRIVVNHLAVVEAGRAGPTASARMDSAYAIDADDAELTAEARGNLESREFAVPDRSGLPIHDAAHVRAAMARFGQYKFEDAAEKKTAYRKICAKAKAEGIDSTGFEAAWSGRLDDACTDRANPLDPGGDLVHATGSMQVQVQPSTSATGAAPGAPQRKDSIVMDELQKQLAAALTDATEQKVKKDAAKARADKAETDLQAANASIAKIEAERDNARKDLDAQRTRADRAEGDLKIRNDGAPAEIEKAVAKAREDAMKDLDARVETRVSAMTAANRVLGATDDKGQPVDRTKMSDRAIKCAIVKHVDKLDLEPDATKPGAKADAYVDAMFDGAVARYDAGARSLGDVRVMVPANPALAPQVPHTDAAGDDEAAATRAMHSRYATAHQNTNHDAVTKSAVLAKGK